MLHYALYGVVAVVVAGLLFLLASWLLPAGEQIAPPLRDDPLWRLPADRRMAADDVDAVRLPVTVRGYRFAETDQLLDRLAAELRQRDEEIERLKQWHEPSPWQPPVSPPQADPPLVRQPDGDDPA